MTTTTPATAEASPPIKIGHTPSNERLQSIDALRGLGWQDIAQLDRLLRQLEQTAQGQ